MSRVDYSDLKQALNEMREDMQRRAAYTSAAAGARAVQKQAIKNAASVPSGKMPGLKDTGALLKNIAIARRPVESGYYFPYHIGVRHGSKKQKKTGNDPWYWWLLEFGYTDRAGRRHKFPFLVPAVVQAAPAAFVAVKASLERSLKRFENRRAMGQK